MAKGFKTSIYETNVSGTVTGDAFEDELVSTGTAVFANVLGSDGTLVVQRKMDSSGQWVDVSSDSVTAGTPLFLIFKAPLLDARAKFTADTTASLVEVAMWSRGRE